MKPTAPPVKRGRPGRLTGLKAPHHLLDHGQAVLDRLGTARLGGVPPCRGDGETFGHFAVFDHLHPAAGLADDGAGIAADKGVAADVLAALDRFKKERFALAANFAIGGEGRFKIRQNPARDRNEISPGRPISEIHL